MVVTALMFAASVVLTQIPDLERLRWHARVVLLFADITSNPAFQKQKELLEHSARELVERDVKVFQIIGSLPPNSTLRSQFHIADSPFAIVLIGKDGGRKLRETKPVEPSELFQLIDSMPMRKNEMGQRQ